MVDNPAGMKRLAGRRIVVTGAASGIGRAVAVRFVAEGARVAALDRDGAGLATLAGLALAMPVDLAERASIAPAIAAAAAALGGIDGIVNAAGVHHMGAADEQDDGAWDAMLAVNLSAPMAVIRAALPHLRQADGATIVNIASGSALFPVPMRSGYIASKGGLVAFSRALAFELAPDIRVNCICPGAVDTPMVRDQLPPGQFDALGAAYALQRIARPEEIADAVLYLTGPESSFVTGIAMAVDGGRTFH